MKNKITTICIDCESGFTAEQTRGVMACPNCGSKSILLDPENEVTIKINTHELRILGIWAENYASSCDVKDRGTLSKRVNKIARKIEAQLSEKHWVPLTLSRELIDLKENLGHNQKITLIKDGKETNI